MAIKPAFADEPLILNNKTMSKDKGSKAIKKTPSLQGKKEISDYQAGKSTEYKTEVVSTNKKHN
ncbi:hypothetical protein [Mucilaginibacter sp.]|uniref:hypothetical protein n=1 Tax=Mucilaginibacter sp. TaxID=1882438 RepID=UPI0025DC0F02|nr:hypothetical protein [Mucilaginibacter sp.]